MSMAVATVSLLAQLAVHLVGVPVLMFTVLAQEVWTAVRKKFEGLGLAG